MKMMLILKGTSARSGSQCAAGCFFSIVQPDDPLSAAKIDNRLES